MTPLDMAAAVGAEKWLLCVLCAGIAFSFAIMAWRLR